MQVRAELLTKFKACDWSVVSNSESSLAKMDNYIAEQFQSDNYLFFL